jgi:hypothetical protein
MKWITVTAVAILLAATFGLRAAIPQDRSPGSKIAQAARLNNLGAAYMDQQLFEKGCIPLNKRRSLTPIWKLPS